MAISTIEVDTDVLKRDIDSINESLKYILSNADHLYDEVAQVNTMWKGRANYSFNIQFRNDHERLKEILKALNKYSESLTTAKEEYDSCEETVYETIKSIRKNSGAW